MVRKLGALTRNPTRALERKQIQICHVDKGFGKYLRYKIVNSTERLVQNGSDKNVRLLTFTIEI